MDKIKITGGIPLHGIIPISGAKNAALPLMAACLLTEETLTLTNLPYLSDIRTMNKLLKQHGVIAALDAGDFELTHSNYKPGGHTLHLCAAEVNNFTAPYDLVRTMRASVVVLGPLLARFGEAKVSLPGGCAIGTRPIDLHLKALEAMGAKITLEGGYVLAEVRGRLKGADIQFDMVSVGATENILMAATLAEGVTTLSNAAREPEVVDLANCLVAMGAQIEGIGTDRIKVTGVKALHGATHRIIPDRIETGTYLTAAAITGGEVTLTGCDPSFLTAVLEKYEEAGVHITIGSMEQEVRTERPHLPRASEASPIAEASIYTSGRAERGASGIRPEQGQYIKITSRALRGVDVMTQPYPGFPTDMQAQFMALMCAADGASMITENIFENRFMHVPELLRMGANVNVHGRSAMVRGVKDLRGAEVMATDLRASVSLVIAALAAKGDTIIHRIYHLDRGYEALEEKLAACGAKVERMG